MTITSHSDTRKMQKTLFGLRSGCRKKESATGPCENNKDTYRKDITRSHAMLMLLTFVLLTINLIRMEVVWVWERHDGNVIPELKVLVKLFL